MREVIGVEGLTVDFATTIKQALADNGFIEFRVDPRLRDEEKFRPKIKGIESPLAHFFEVPIGYELKDIPRIMEDRIIRPPKDLREIIALGKVLTGEKVEKFIFAPDITGEQRKFLQVARWPDWNGFGLSVHGFDRDDENLCEMPFVGFSNT